MSKTKLLTYQAHEAMALMVPEDRLGYPLVPMTIEYLPISSTTGLYHIDVWTTIEGIMYHVFGMEAEIAAAKASRVADDGMVLAALDGSAELAERVKEFGLFLRDNGLETYSEDEDSAESHFYVPPFQAPFFMGLSADMLPVNHYTGIVFTLPKKFAGRDDITAIAHYGSPFPDGKTVHLELMAMVGSRLRRVCIGSKNLPRKKLEDDPINSIMEAIQETDNIGLQYGVEDYLSWHEREKESNRAFTP